MTDAFVRNCLCLRVESLPDKFAIHVLSIFQMYRGLIGYRQFIFAYVEKES